MEYGGLTNREILILVADRTERLEDAVHGNGQPGLVAKVAALEAVSVPGKKERWGVVAAVAVALIGMGAKVLGVA